MLTQKPLVPHQYFLGILFVVDQNQTTCYMFNKAQIQLVEMQTKTIRWQKRQLFIIKRSKREQNIPTSKATKRNLSKRI